MIIRTEPDEMPGDHIFERLELGFILSKESAIAAFEARREGSVNTLSAS